MSIEIKPYTYDDGPEFDNCGNDTVALMNINNTIVPFCKDCLSSITDSLEEFNNTIFCHKCEKFIMSRSGWRYGGSCRKEKDIDINDAGYVNFRECMDTCSDAILKEE